MAEAVRHIRSPVAVLLAVLAVGVSLAAVSAEPASGASLTSSRAKKAVIKYVKGKFGSDYAVHPACYKLSRRKAKCLVHMVHNSSSCTKYATVTLRGRRASVSMARPSC
jgi:hypothetical protein